jgi:hypothetical protein
MNLNGHLAIMIGPAFNGHVSELKPENTGKFSTDIALNPHLTETHNDFQLQLWVTYHTLIKKIFPSKDQLS